jgi:acetylornithine deacetylase/succinyl-diaminopimelate desuccinylase-like protein
MLQTALEYARSHQGENLDRLCEWLRIPSVSTLPEHIPDVARAGKWAAEYLASIGMRRVEIAQTPGHPIVYAEHLDAGSPTLLVYGHFDVQPADPLEEWRTPPFEPQIVGDNLYARGANDDKGQVFTILAALEAYLKTSGRLPLNVKVLLEGEEEVTSPHLAPYLREHRQELLADAVLIADQEMLSPQAPLILYGARGNVYMEIEVRGPAQDLHSGTFGGAVDNPFNVLVRLLAALQDSETHRVNIPGFYDRVRPLSEDERRLLAKAPISDDLGLILTGAPALAGEAGYSLAERISVRPTLDIHGIAGGFTGEGGKTVIPAKATAKLSTRLVPDQDPHEVASLCESYLRQIAPPTVTLEVRTLGVARPAVIDYSAAAVRAAALAYERGIGASAIYFRGGGSLPIIKDMIDLLSQPDRGEIPIVMIGFGLPDDNTHAPNEKLYLPNFYRGIETVIHYLDIYASK